MLDRLLKSLAAARLFLRALSNGLNPRQALAIVHASAFLIISLAAGLLTAAEPRQPLHHTVDLNIGEAQEVTLWDGTIAKVKLLDITETRDTVRSAVRRA